MYFAVSGVEVAPSTPFLVALGISFFTSMGGVSGAFLLLPFQMSILGYTSPSVSATNQLFNIVAIPSGVYRYWREGRMVWPLTILVIAGTLPGVLLGALIRIKYLPDPGKFKLFAAAVLLYIGTRMIYGLVTSNPGSTPVTRQFPSETPPSQTSPYSADQIAAVQTLSFDLRLFRYSYNGQEFNVPVSTVFLLSLVVGVVGGVYGIGGGAIIAPFLVTFLSLPVHTVAGAALMGTFVTSIAGVAFYQAIATFYPDQVIAPDYPLGILFGLGGMAGMYLGARCQKHIPATVIKCILAAIIMFIATQYLIPVWY